MLTHFPVVGAVIPRLSGFETWELRDYNTFGRSALKHLMSSVGDEDLYRGILAEGV